MCLVYLHQLFFHMGASEVQDGSLHDLFSFMQAGNWFLPHPTKLHIEQTLSKITYLLTSTSRSQVLCISRLSIHRKTRIPDFGKNSNCNV